jgi:glyoxylase-like metal-dependent hydrolase (beta-lactamase superfamily II)
MSDGSFEVYAIRYAHHERKASENYIGGDLHDGIEPLDYFVWAIKGADRAFVVDTGFDPAMAKKRGRTILRPVGEGLKAIGIDPDAVEHVIVTHLHYDHAGNYDLFPRARYHLQDVEMAFATGRHMCHAQMRVPFEEEDVVAMVRKVFAGRIEFHDGDDELASGLTLHRIGGHSMGLQSVRVRTRRGHVVLDNVADVIEGYRTLKRLASSAAHIVPGHDPKVLVCYPSARAETKDWIARLDADPK